jgi:hypothetical protein
MAHTITKVCHEEDEEKEEMLPPIVKLAKTDTNTVPKVQKYSTASRYFPLSSEDKNSARISNGTTNPPIPNPRIVRITIRDMKFVAMAVKHPNVDIMMEETKMIGRLPYRSPRGPKMSVPRSCPANTLDVIVAVCRDDKFHSYRRTADK